MNVVKSRYFKEHLKKYYFLFFNVINSLGNKIRVYVGQECKYFTHDIMAKQLVCAVLCVILFTYAIQANLEVPASVEFGNNT